MKYVVVLYDGMADYPIDVLDNKTPMMAADKPIFDSLAKKGEVGLVKTIGDGLKPGSEIGNLTVMGYDPRKYYTGRSPLEAISIGVKMAEDDIALRCNLVTLSDEADYDNKTMVDYSAGDISSEEAAEIIKSVQEAFGGGEFDFYSGVSYRHCLIHHKGTTDLGTMTPPHDISGRVVGPYISDSENAKKLTDLMRKSYDLLKDHPVNKKRIAQGKRPANSIWLWGEGTRPELPAFSDIYGIKGTVISAVDLLKGIAIAAGMDAPDVSGATGYIDTNFEGKANAAVEALKTTSDFVYIHIEAPDECGHRFEPDNKVKSIEYIDSRVLPIVIKGLEEIGDDYKIMILPDHPTPLSTRTHASDPVPYMIYQKSKETDSGVDSIDEESAKLTGKYIENGYDLMPRFIKEI